MNILRVQKSWDVVNTVGLLFITVCFIFIHFNSKPAQTQLTYLVWVLPLFLLLPIRKTIYSAEVSFLCLVLLIFASSLVTYGFQGSIFDQSFRSHWTYLLAIGVLSVFSQTKLSKYYLFALLALASLMVAYDVVSEHISHGTRGLYTHGKPIFYGNIALTTGLISLILSTNKNSHWLVRLLLLFSTAAGVAGSIWSQTRGGWIFLILFSLCFFYIVVIGRERKSYISGASILLVLLLAVLPFQTEIGGRLNQAHSNIENYFKYGERDTSVGLRFELWRVSIKQFIDSPVIGSARIGFLDKKSELVGDKSVTEVALLLEHAHSDVFWTLGSKGLLGIFTLYGLYAYLLYFYYSNCNDERVRLYALSGLAVVSSYFIYGLSESFFSMKLGIGYFIIINLILLRLISKGKEEAPFYSNGR